MDHDRPPTSVRDKNHELILVYITMPDGSTYCITGNFGKH